VKPLDRIHGGLCAGGHSDVCPSECHHTDILLAQCQQAACRVSSQLRHDLRRHQFEVIEIVQVQHLQVDP
jgi:hypothetical protein